MTSRNRHFSKNYSEVQAVLTELRKVFDKCDINASGEVEVEPLVNQLCTVMPIMENQKELKVTLYEKLSSDCSTVKREKFEECVTEWIDLVFEENHYAFLSPISPRRWDVKFTVSTPTKPSYFQHQDFNNVIEDDLQFENEKDMSQQSNILKLKTEFEEEVLMLRQRNKTLESMLHSRNQLSGQDKSPCKNCHIIQSEINGLKKKHNQITEVNNRQFEELNEELVRCKEEREKLNHRNAQSKKKEETLQYTIFDLQKQLSECNDYLINEKQKVEDWMKLVTELHQEKTKNKMHIEYIESKLVNASAEIDSLKKDIVNLEELVISQMNNLKMPLSIEGEGGGDCCPFCSSIPAENNLMEEIRNEIGNTFYDCDVSVQTSIEVKNQEVQTSITHNVDSQSYAVLDYKNRILPLVKDSGDLGSTVCKNNEVSDKYQATNEEEEEESLYRLQINFKSQKKVNKSRYLFLCTILIVLPLMISAIIYSSTRGYLSCLNHSGKFFNFNVPFVYLKRPPL